MPAGHDFDALLMGALYGELSAVEQSRLQAHLAAHPADQQIFHDLTRTREAIRAGVASAIVEPPQAISALLLQEAARRAPKSAIAAASADGPGRWMRWLSSLLAHPGLAAAAMLTVVVGVAGSMYLRGGAKFAESTESVSSSAPAAPAPAGAAEGYAMQEPSAAATAGAGSGALAQQPQKAPEGGLPGDSPADLRVAEQLSATAWQDSYSVGLDADGKSRGKNEQVALRRRGGPDSVADAAPAKPAKRDYLEAKPVDDVKLKDFDDALSDRAELAQAVKQAERQDKVAKESREAGEAKLKSKRAAEDFDSDISAADEEVAAAPPPPATEAPRSEPRGQKGGGASYESEKAEPAPPKTVARVSAPSANAVSGAAPAAPGNAPIPAPITTVPVAPTTPSRSSTSSKADTSVARKPAVVGNTAPAAAPAPKPAEVATGSSTVDSSGSIADKKSATDEAWAKSEHARLLRLAKANQCSEAAAIAGAIAIRAPRYYQDQVATDTKLRVCQAAIRDQLNLQSEQSKRRKSPARANEAAPAPAAKK